jgi:LuxR family maltose regulon positive regulatory protein
MAVTDSDKNSLEVLELLTTKVFRPTTNYNLLNRPALLAGLSRQPRPRLILICAPAGFGKTAIASAWAEKAETACGWLSLEESDNDPVRFWSYFAFALEPWLPGLVQQVASFFSLLQPLPIEQLLSGFINQMTLLNEDLTLVLDDYHLITSPVIEHGLEFLLEHLPPHFQLIITTRTEPDLPLPRLRLRRQLIELRADDLRFNGAEIQEFLDSFKGLKLSEQELGLLEQRTEGWIAALQLAALSLQSAQDKTRFIQAFQGNSLYLFEYLAQEVLEGQPETVQHFLLQTSILNRLTAGLVETVTGCEDGQAMLEKLERANLFVVALDGERHWYRYHHLFKEYLQTRLVRTQPEHLALLHQWAAQWYAEQKLYPEAIYHALAAQDYEYSAALIEQIAARTIQQGELSTLLGWAKALPPALLASRPSLALDYVWALTFTFQIEKAQELLEKVVKQLSISEPGDKGRLWNKINFLKAYLAGNQGDFNQALHYGHLALENLNETETVLQLFIRLVVVNAYILKGDLLQAESNLQDLLGQSRKTGQPIAILMAMYVLCYAFCLRGKLGKAHKLAEEILQLSAALTGESEATVGINLQPALPVLMACFVLSEVAREGYQLTEAQHWLNRLLETAEQAGTSEFSYMGYIYLARLRVLQKDEAGVREALGQARFIEEQHPPQTSRVALVGVIQVWVWLELGELDTAMTNLEHYDKLHQSYYNDLDELYQLAQAKVLLAQANYPQAETLLESLLEKFRGLDWTRLIIEVLLLQTRLYTNLDQKEQALNSLSAALRLGEIEGYIASFVEGGPEVARLLPQVVLTSGHSDVSPVYLNQLKAICNQFQMTGTSTSNPVGSTSIEAEVAGLVEPLTEREREVLELLVKTDFESTEIAQELVIAVSTVRYHIKQIYRKLGVQSRLQAIKRAEQLDLLA